MSKFKNVKNNVLGNIASIQTLLERYPILMTVNPQTGDSSLSFMLDLLKILGVTDEMLLDWMSNLISGKDGLLKTIEASLKGILIAWFKNMYTCSINPILPESIMMTISGTTITPHGEGIKINIDDIDYFGVLNNCPTTNDGEIFYFDNNKEDGYTPLNIYSSTDFNAYLWYVINRGSLLNPQKNIWDNRVYYIKNFEKDNSLVGNFGEDTNKGKFMYTRCENSPIRMVNGVGPKKEIIISQFVEQSGQDYNYLNIFLPKDRYYSTLGKKTIFEFNFDYISSLKLFDSKTLATQIVNAVIGLSNVKVNVSFERYAIEEKIRAIVERIMEDGNDGEDDCYFSFSNDEYNEMQKRALERYKNVKTDSEAKSEIKDSINLIKSNSSKSDITYALQQVIHTVTTTDAKDNYSISTEDLNIVKRFIKELSVELCLQILSPKVMLLFAINEKIMNPKSEKMMGVDDFFKKFKNMLTSVIKRIHTIILKLLYDFLMGQLKPILVLFVEKLLLETIMYYRALLKAMFETCGNNFGKFNLSLFGTDPLIIDNVIGADIEFVPTEDKPRNEC